MESEDLDVLLRRKTQRFEGRLMRQGLAGASSGGPPSARRRQVVSVGGWYRPIRST